MPSLLFEASKWWNSPYINHFISADTVVSSYANPQTLNRYSYVSNNPVRYTDPTGHMLVEDSGGAGSVCPDQKCRDEVKIRKQLGNFKKNLQSCLQKGIACASMSQPTIVTLSAQHCTSSSPCIENLVPSAVPTGAPLPFMTAEEVKRDVVPFVVPSNPLKPNFAPSLDEVWHNLANGVPPLFGVPGVDVYVKRIVDGIPGAIETANYILVNHSAYMISGGISPTIPIVPYFPSANPFTPVYQ
jgi:hypothetical protein